MFKINMKCITRIIFFIFILFYAFAANCAEPLLGAFGKKLGEKYLFDDVVSIAESEDAFIVQYDYIPPLPILSKFVVLLTPISYQIYGIMASDQLSNSKECKDWMAALAKIAVEKYYNKEAGDKLYAFGDQEGILLEIKNNRRWIKISCDDAQLTMAYGDSSFDEVQQQECTHLNNLRTRFLNKQYDEIKNEARTLSDQNVLQAQTMLGFMYRTGNGVTQDNTKAEYYYTQAANKNYPGALFNLGTFLMSESRLDEAEKWLLKGAKLGLQQAQYNLGQLYVNKRNPPNYKDAFRWFRESAERGHMEGQYNTCHMYSAGDGVTRNEVQAYMWCDIAARNGHSKARDNRDFIAKRMSQEQIQQARSLADQWWNNHSK